MGTSDAERARRSRRHRGGDHSTCDPRRCDGVTPVTDPEQARRRPPRLGTRGTRLWEEERGDSLTGTRRVLLEEACRTADRLDRLNAIVNGRDRAWLTLEIDEAGIVTVVVDKALSEARQQQLTMKQLAAELRQGAAAAPAETGGSVFDQLAARREARRAGTAG